jgi:hypothetical protein
VFFTNLMPISSFDLSTSKMLSNKKIRGILTRLIGHNSFSLKGHILANMIC